MTHSFKFFILSSNFDELLVVTYYGSCEHIELFINTNNTTFNKEKNF